MRKSGLVYHEVAPSFAAGAALVHLVYATTALQHRCHHDCSRPTLTKIPRHAQDLPADAQTCARPVTSVPVVPVLSSSQQTSSATISEIVTYCECTVM